jgi:subtilisin family serine protease
MEMKNFLRLFAVVMVVVLVASLTTPAYTSNQGKMRVWVEFVPGQGNQVEKALNGVGAEHHYRFDDLNSFVVTVPENALNGLRHNPNVVSIEEDAVRYAYGETVPYGIDMVQSREIWDANRDGSIDAGAPTGADRMVCIIDSGLYTAHEDFQGVNVVGGYPANWAEDTCGHGTHVAGTITAAFNEVGVVGVNPGGTNLFIVKVFGDDCAWTYSSTLVDAASHCASAGANVISMSLGGTQKSKQEERAFNTHYAQGILSIAAAGNDGTTGISYPGGYSSVMSVAAIDENKLVADFSQKNSTVEIAAPGVAVLSTLPYIETNYAMVEGVEYDANHVEFAPYGEVSAPLADGGLCLATDSALSGTIALCQRGDISFYDKVINAQGSGAAGVIIYNNEPGNDLFTLGEGNTSEVMAISLSMEDGLYLVENKLGQSATLHADIQWEANGYEKWDGTSMATPHVSGVAALIWSANTTWTNAEIRDALTNTAEDLGDPGRDVAYGYGLVQAKAALNYLGGVEPPPPPDDIQMFAEVSTDKSTYSDRERVTITVTAWDPNNQPVSGAAVTVTINKPTGSTATLSGVTGTDGVVSLSYSIRIRKDGSGTFNVNALVTKDGYLNATASTTFSAQ